MTIIFYISNFFLFFFFFFSFFFFLNTDATSEHFFRGFQKVLTHGVEFLNSQSSETIEQLTPNFKGFFKPNNEHFLNHGCFTGCLKFKLGAFETLLCIVLPQKMDMDANKRYRSLCARLKKSIEFEESTNAVKYVICMIHLGIDSRTNRIASDAANVLKNQKQKKRKTDKQMSKFFAKAQKTHRSSSSSSSSSSSWSSSSSSSSSPYG